MSKFQVGDRVRITEEYQFEADNPEHIGWEGTVTKIGCVFPYRVRMDNQAEDFDWHMFEEELELVSD